MARVEVPLDDLPRLVEPAIRAAMIRAFRGLGFKYVTLDLEGFRSGSLNAVIPLESLQRPGRDEGLRRRRSIGHRSSVIRHPSSRKDRGLRPMPRATCRCGQVLSVPVNGPERVICPKCSARIRVRRDGRRRTRGTGSSGSTARAGAG